MRWRRGPRSANIEDRRGRRAMPRGGSIGCGAFLLIFALSVLFRQNFFTLLDPAAGSGGGFSTTPSASSGDVSTSPEEEELVDFVSFVLDDIQGTWHQLLPGQYQDAQLVLFRDVVRSACGMAGSATGPFYCPGDQKLYVDLGFFDELRRSFGAPGDFAQAYVIAHEIGHHVQKLLGIESQVRRAQSQRPGQANELSVRMELQADCLAGVWGRTAAAKGILEQGDIEEGLNAAAAIGDDRIQRMSQGRVSPESFTHGSSQDRVTWLRQGIESGDPETCDTFQ